MDKFFNRHLVGWRKFPQNWFEGKLFTLFKQVKGLFGKRFLVTLFKFCENTYEWKSVWKYVL